MVLNGGLQQTFRGRITVAQGAVPSVAQAAVTERYSRLFESL
jgi:hypothetical protein